MRNSFRKIAEFIDSVKTPDKLSELFGTHRFNERETRSFRDVWDRHNSNQVKQQRFLFLNTYLLDARFVAEKPAVDDRARAIGNFVKSNFDVAAFCEIFETNVQEKVFSAWSGGRPRFYQSDAFRNTRGSSGLVTISQQYELLKSGFHEFDHEEGSDRFADKGILFTTLDVGLGSSKLEIYNTHLNADGNNARRNQIAEVAKFIERKHNANNPAIVVGDFNVGANRKDTFIPRGYSTAVTEHNFLLDEMDKVGFYDLWVARNGTPGYTSSMEKDGVPRTICRLEGNSFYCNDDVPKPRDLRVNSDRIDYMFVSSPQASHSFKLDFTRPRRVAKERRRGAPERDKIAYLSDHLGLATTLVMSPK